LGASDRGSFVQSRRKGADIRQRAILAAGFGLAVFAAFTAGAARRLRRFEIVEASMQPAFDPGDWVVARRRRRVPTRGKVVVFEHPDHPGMFLVKRVIGLPGERIDIAKGRVAVDGGMLAEPWAVGSTLPDGTWQVPEDAVFLLGDRRAVSAGDGRSTGPIPLTDVKWIVTVRYWPLARAGLL
jgi:signal peptidase I